MNTNNIIDKFIASLDMNNFLSKINRIKNMSYLDTSFFQYIKAYNYYLRDYSYIYKYKNYILFKPFDIKYLKIIGTALSNNNIVKNYSFKIKKNILFLQNKYLDKNSKKNIIKYEINIYKIKLKTMREKLFKKYSYNKNILYIKNNIDYKYKELIKKLNLLY